MNLKLIILFFLFLFLQTPKLVAQEALISWDIVNGRISNKAYPEDTLAQLYWTKVLQILPDSILYKYVKKITLFSDGLKNELGGMSPLNDNNDAWEIDLDTLDMNLRNPDSSHTIDYLHTLIHEFGHLLSLNDKQVYPTKDQFQDDNKGYLTSEGYAFQSSYLSLFTKRFWPMDLLNEWDKIDQIRNERRKLNLLYDFYLVRAQSFINDYAAESPEEDLAESWTFFVLSDSTSGHSIKHQKINFFYQFDELVDYRTQIRSALPFIPKQYLIQFR